MSARRDRWAGLDGALFYHRLLLRSAWRTPTGRLLVVLGLLVALSLVLLRVVIGAIGADGSPPMRQAPTEPAEIELPLAALAFCFAAWVLLLVTCTTGLFGTSRSYTHAVLTGPVTHRAILVVEMAQLHGLAVFMGAVLAIFPDLIGWHSWWVGLIVAGFLDASLLLAMGLDLLLARRPLCVRQRLGLAVLAVPLGLAVVAALAYPVVGMEPLLRGLGWLSLPGQPFYELVQAEPSRAWPFALLPFVLGLGVQWAVLRRSIDLRDELPRRAEIFQVQVAALGGTPPETSAQLRAFGVDARKLDRQRSELRLPRWWGLGPWLEPTCGAALRPKSGILIALLLVVPTLMALGAPSALRAFLFLVLPCAGLAATWAHARVLHARRSWLRSLPQPFAVPAWGVLLQSVGPLLLAQVWLGLLAVAAGGGPGRLAWASIAACSALLQLFGTCLLVGAVLRNPSAATTGTLASFGAMGVFLATLLGVFGVAAFAFLAALAVGLVAGSLWIGPVATALVAAALPFGLRWMHRGWLRD